MFKITNRVFSLLLVCASAFGANAAQAEKPATAAAVAASPTCAPVFKYSMRQLHSKNRVDLCALTANKVVMVVNTASHCGFTSQFKPLEALHKKYKGKDFVLIGVASNSFNQEDASEQNAAKICFVNFGVSFTMLAPVDVKGATSDPFFKGITSQSSEPNWNFNKYLLNKQGKVVAKFGSITAPDSSKITKQIDGLLAQ